MFFKGKKARILILSLTSIFIISLMFFLCTCRREINQIQIMYPSEDIYYTFIYDDAAEEGVPGNIDKEIADKFIQYKSDTGENVDLSSVKSIQDGTIDITKFQNYNFKVLFYDSDREIYIITKPVKEYTNNRFYWHLFPERGTMNLELRLDLYPGDYESGDVFVSAEYANYYDYVIHQGAEYILKGLFGILIRVIGGLVITFILAVLVFRSKNKSIYLTLLILKSIELLILNVFFHNKAEDLGTVIIYIPIFSIVSAIIETRILKRRVRRYEVEDIREWEVSLLMFLTCIIIPLITFLTTDIVPMI